MHVVIKLVIAAVLGVGGFFLASSAHFDVFPCVVENYNFQTNGHDSPSSDMCSLLKVNQSGSYDSADRAKLTGGGYAVGVLLFGVAPLLLVFGLARVFRRKRA